MKHAFKHISLVLMVVLVGASLAVAQPYRGFHRGVRPLGMGGAFTAVADDHNAIHYNPAGLSRAESFGIGILNPMVAFSEDSYDLYSDFDEIDQDNTAEVAKLLKAHLGENNHVELATDLYTGFKWRNSGVMVAGVARGYADMAIRNPTFPELHLTADLDVGGQIGVGHALTAIPGLRIGAGGKVLNRSSVNEVYTAVEIASNKFEDTIEDDKRDGTDASFDLGLIWSREVLGFTTMSIGVAGLNLKEMEFGDARDQKRQINVGVAFEQRWMGFTLTEALDVHDITDNLAGDDSKEKKVHLGAELQFPYIVSVRAGLNQGYFTAGASVDIKVFRFDVATYGEEVGVVGGQKEDRRYVGQVSIGWSW